MIDLIQQNPHDDRPRLVYADWLEEKGGPDALALATFIRAQCAAEKQGERVKNRKRAEALIREHHAQWVLPFQQLHASPRFRRGFVEHIAIDASRFAESATRLFALAPLLRSARLREASNEVATVVTSKELLKLEALDLTRMCSCGRCPIELEQPLLFASPLLANIQELSLADCRLSAENAALLAASPSLHQLRKLDLADNRLGTAALQALATPSFTGLQQLSLRKNKLTDAAVVVLLGSPLLCGLTELDLSNNQLGDEAALALGDETSALMQRLDLTANPISVKAQAQLRARLGKRFIFRLPVEKKKPGVRSQKPTRRAR